jgi:hypothetical protein
MPRLSIWNSGKKGATYHYIDRQLSQWFGASGTAVYVHLYEGTHDQQAPDGEPVVHGVTSIQDVLLLENRERKYSDVVYELRGIYNVNDVDFDLRQFGFFLQNDSLFIELHMNDSISQLGRKIMSGDVLELPHMRDDALLDGGKAINKFYVVDDVNRASDGYSPTWYPHILRVKCSPMAAAEEYNEILNKQARDPFGMDDGRIRDLMSTLGRDMALNEEIVEQAQASVSGRNFETRHFYFVPGSETGDQLPWIFAGDGHPPNGAELLDSGNTFPDSPSEGAYVLRTDWSPHTLFRYVEGAWRIQEQDYREGEWSVARRLLRSFINNAAEDTMDDGTVRKTKTALHVAAKPGADF